MSWSSLLSTAGFGPLAPLMSMWSAKAAGEEQPSNADLMAQLAGGLGMWSMYGTFKGASAQEKAAKKAADLKMEAAKAGAAEIERGNAEAMASAIGGRDSAMADYGTALQNAQAYQHGLGGLYAQERQGGTNALLNLNRAFAGDASALPQDPGAAFRQQEMQRALARQASAGGYYGGGQHFRNLMSGTQQLQSQEYNNAIGRLMGLAQSGLQAESAYQGMNQNAANNVMGIYGAQADLLGQSGQFLANLRNNAAAQQANALNTQASTTNDLNINLANLQANSLSQMGANAQSIGTGLGQYFSRK